VLVHAVDNSGQLVAQADGPPAGGERPTTGWRAGEVVADRRTLELPPGWRGALTLLVGLYDPTDPDLVPLPARLGDQAFPDGRVPAAEVLVR
jgi:hypothetical protein